MGSKEYGFMAAVLCLERDPLTNGPARCLVHCGDFKESTAARHTGA
jgi:hypothetical protein